MPLFRICPSCGKPLPQQPGTLQIPACAECLGSSDNPTLIEAWRTHLLELQAAEKKKPRHRHPSNGALTILLALSFVIMASYIANSYLMKRQADILSAISEPDVVSVTEIEPPAKPTNSPKSAE